jgi:hypothetical protein
MLRVVISPEEMETVRVLFREYTIDSLSFDVSFQDFEQELAELPGNYAPQSGRLLLATPDGEPAGCVALMPFAEGMCGE